MLISKQYAREQRLMHENPRYGAASKKFSHLVSDLISEYKPSSILDYGAGKCVLRESLGKSIDGIDFREYDPGIKGLSRLPRGSFDLVCCIDVLEHIEPDCLDSVLSAIRKKTGCIFFATVHTGPAGKFLSDGRNAHLIQKPVDWWEEKLSDYFPSVNAKMENKTTAILFCKVNND